MHLLFITLHFLFFLSSLSLSSLKKLAHLSRIVPVTRMLGTVSQYHLAQSLIPDSWYYELEF